MKKYECNTSSSITQRHFFPALDDGFKLLIIALVVSAHDTVPYIEVQAEIAIDIFVVQIMMRGGIAPEGMYAPREPAPEYLISGMAAYVQHQLVQAPGHYRQRMYRYQKDHDRYDRKLHHRLYGVE